MSAVSYLLTLDGSRAQFRCPRPGVQSEHGRPTSRRRLLGGGVVVQRGRVARRSWTVDLSWASPADVAGLLAVEQGALGLAYYWYDQVAARVNMLDACTALPGAGAGVGCWSPVDGSSTADTSTVGVLDVTGTGAATDPVPVLPDRVYTLAVESTTTGGDATLDVLDAAGSVLSSHVAAVPAGGRGTVTTPPLPASAATVRVTVPAGSWTRPQVTDTAAAVAWHPGMGIPRVVITGVTEAYQAAWGGTRRDLSCTLIEVD